MYRELFLDKTTGTFADALTAFGMARVVGDLLFHQEGNDNGIRLMDEGAYYHLLFPALDDETLAHAVNPIGPIINREKVNDLPSDIPNSFDFEAAKEKNNERWAARERGISEDQLPPKPYQWDVLVAINNPIALPGYNDIVLRWWNARDAQIEVLRLVLDLFSRSPNDFQLAVDRWKVLAKAQGWDIKLDATCQQLFNPDKGKGQNEAKADGLSGGGSGRNLDGFWLIEWLKAIGFYEGGVPRLVRRPNERKAKDRKTFVVAARHLLFEDHQAIMSEFRNRMGSGTSTQFDILAAIRYMRVLLVYYSSEPTRLSRLLGLRNIRKNLVAGFYTAFYKNLGKASAVMNVSFMGLPGWVEVNNTGDVETYQAMLGDFEKFVRQFREEESDAFTLLQDLRDFVSGDDLTAFFHFTDAFPAYLMGRRERNKIAMQLNVEFIERLIQMTEKSLSPILESPGFQNIAYAIRQSTVVAQYQKKQGSRKYDVRYGLGQELARKARYSQDFIAALSEFLLAYNAENAQVMETRPGPYRRSIKTADIDEVVHLIDEYGAPTVAKLLIAYGYARMSREDDDSTLEPEEIQSMEEE